MKTVITALVCTLLCSAPAKAQTIAWDPPGLTPQERNIELLFTTSSGNVFAEAGMIAGILYRSTDKGASWLSVYDQSKIYDLVELPNGALLAGKPGKLLRSTDNGATWKEIDTDASSVYRLARDGDRIFGGGYNGELWLSTNNGDSWQILNQPVLDQNVIGSVGDIFVRGDLIVYKHQFYGLRVSRDAGKTWSLIPDDLGPAFVRQSGDAAYLPHTFPGKVYEQLARTTDFQNYTLVSDMQTFSPNGVAIRGNVFVITSYAGPYISTDAGKTWAMSKQGLQSESSLSAAIDPMGYIYVGTDCCVQRSKQSVVMTGAESPDAPADFQLQAPYPNPFSSHADLVLRLGHPQRVRLDVYNILGQHVRVLTEDQLPAGEVHIGFDSGGLPSGTYFLRAQGEGASQLQRAIVVR